MKQFLSAMTLTVFLLAATFASQAQADDIQDHYTTPGTLDLNLDPPGGDDDPPPIGG